MGQLRCKLHPWGPGDTGRTPRGCGQQGGPTCPAHAATLTCEAPASGWRSSSLTPAVGNQPSGSWVTPRGPLEAPGGPPQTLVPPSWTCAPAALGAPAGPCTHTHPTLPSRACRTKASITAVSQQKRTCTCVCACTYMCACAFLCACVYTCVSARERVLPVCTCVYVCACTCALVCVCLCARVRVCLCTCVHV